MLDALTAWLTRLARTESGVGDLSGKRELPLRARKAGEITCPRNRPTTSISRHSSREERQTADSARCRDAGYLGNPKGAAIFAASQSEMKFPKRKK
jgi:hypothetical protein